MNTSKPSITKTSHLLPFLELSPSQFERLCLWLVEREGYLHPQHLGEAGSEQGRDVTAYKAADTSEQLWYFQCKRYQKINAKTLIAELHKYHNLAAADPANKPFGIVFVTNAVLSAKAREEVEEACRAQGYACEFWAHTELDLLVKKYRDIVEEFFDYGPPPAIQALHQLPPPPPDFTGRVREMADLRKHLTAGVTISGVQGMGGVGKTALALKLADELKNSYPDAQFYLDLKGVSAQPLSAADAMRHIIYAYHPTARLPDDTDQLAATYNWVFPNKGTKSAIEFYGSSISPAI